jgi:cytoskeletal protein RodZ
MSKTILLTAFLLLSTAWIVAQQTTPDASSAPQTQTAPDTSSASQTTATTSTSQTTTSTGSQSGTSSDANANTIQGMFERLNRELHPD